MHLCNMVPLPLQLSTTECLHCLEPMGRALILLYYNPLNQGSHRGFSQCETSPVTVHVPLWHRQTVNKNPTLQSTMSGTKLMKASTVSNSHIGSSLLSQIKHTYIPIHIIHKTDLTVTVLLYNLYIAVAIHILK